MQQLMFEEAGRYAWREAAEPGDQRRPSRRSFGR